MQEIFVIYNEANELPKGGYPIDGGAGIITREWDEAHKDGSTTTERIPEILAKKPGRKVIYFVNQNVPNSEKDKIKNGKIAKLKEEDKQFIASLKPKSEIRLLEERIAALEAQLLEG